MDHDRLLRKQLADILAWEDAHVGLEKAVAGLPSAKAIGAGLLWKPFPMPCTV